MDFQQAETTRKGYIMNKKTELYIDQMDWKDSTSFYSQQMTDCHSTTYSHSEYSGEVSKSGEI